MKSLSFKTLVITSTAIALMLSSCNTMRGLGRDVSRLGDGVERSADYGSSRR